MFEYLWFLAGFFCLLGVAFRFSKWVLKRPCPVAAPTTVPECETDLKIGPSSYGVHLPAMAMSVYRFLADIFFQRRIFKKSVSRWLMHMCIFWGFSGLVVMHALAFVTSENWFDNYYPTVNPYMFLRNVFGLMAMAGVAAAFFRRRSVPIVRSLTTRQDLAVLGLIFMIMLSGHVLEALKITSEAEFDEMAADYAGIVDTEDEEAKGLKAFWTAEYGLVCNDPLLKQNDELIASGRELHVEYCLDCHAKPQWAFVSYPIGKVISPVAVFLDRLDSRSALWFVHVVLCLAGLAWLPFGKMFHLISSPFHFWSPDQAGRPSADEMFRSQWKIALDACVNCAGCSVTCSVAPLFSAGENKLVLPSERMKVIQKWIRSGKIDENTVANLRRGNAVCTECRRCSAVCPNGIDTLAVSKSACESILKEKQVPSIEERVQGALEPSAVLFQAPGAHQRLMIRPSGDTAEEGRFLRKVGSACFSCKTCTASCPVVGNSDDPGSELGLVPHQIMHALGMGLSDRVLHAPMIWSCTTCYTCQENCPQGVSITEIILQIRNDAFKSYGDAGAVIDHLRNIPACIESKGKEVTP